MIYVSLHDIIILEYIATENMMFSQKVDAFIGVKYMIKRIISCKPIRNGNVIIAFQIFKNREDKGCLVYMLRSHDH